MMVLLSSMTGGMDSAGGFADNFNLLVPLMLDDESERYLSRSVSLVIFVKNIFLLFFSVIKQLNSGLSVVA